MVVLLQLGFATGSTTSTATATAIAATNTTPTTTTSTGISPPHTQAQTLSAVTSNLTNGNLNTELSAKPEITCQHCCSQETPEWRRGPEGSRTLCNACGLFYSS